MEQVEWIKYIIDISYSISAKNGYMGGQPGALAPLPASNFF